MSLPCHEPTCDEVVADNKWAKIRAGDAGWYFGRDGRAFCPRHPPPWALGRRVRNEPDTPQGTEVEP